MAPAFIFTLAMFAVFVALRWPYLRLPLHIDTGFYVSNHTVRHRRLRFGRGWNARFAACSKLLPELFYSLVYLRHGGAGYSRWSRRYYSVVHFLTAIGLGAGMASLSGDPRAYWAGLAVFALLACEPFYGVYFESAEQLELPFQVLGFSLLALGLGRQEPWLVGLGVLVWAAQSLVIKLSSLLPTATLAVSAAVAFPRAISHILAALALPFFAFIVFCSLTGVRPWKLLGPIVRYERHCGPRRSAKAYSRQLRGKAALLAHIVLGRPVIPALALVSVVLEPPGWLFAVYAVGLASCYFLQAARVWYYALPLQPIVAWLAASGALQLWARGLWWVVLGAAALWLCQHVMDSYGALVRGGVAELGRRAWRPHGAEFAQKNLALELAVPVLRPHVEGRSLFVFGMWNQAYVLLDASWDTTLVSAANWLDSMQPLWWIELNERLVAEPPAAILDTDHCLDEELMRETLGLAYELVAEAPPSFRLFRFVGQKEPKGLWAKLYAPSVPYQ